MSTFKIETVVVEVAKAFILCKRCLGFGWTSEQTTSGITANISDETCPACNGNGGTWHDTVEPYGIPDGIALLDCDVVTKSSILTRKWGVCGECKGKGFKPAHCSDCEGPCSHCKGTGCEPGTAKEWEVRDD